MELVFDYIRNDALRHQLNALTRKTFGFDFEKWVATGYYEGDYIPYSFVETGRCFQTSLPTECAFCKTA